MSTENPRTTTENEEGFDLKELLSKLIINWRWFVLSLIICLFAAAMYLRYKTEVYSVQATVQINDEKKGSYQNQMKALQDFGLASNTGGIDNEIEIMRSKSLVKEVVKDLKLYTIYTIHGRVQKNVIYGKYPVEVNISEEDLENLTSGTMLTITQPTENTYKVSYKLRNPETGKIVEKEEKIDSLPYIIESPIGQLIITKGEGSPLPSNLKMTVSVVPPIRMAKRCLAGLSIAPTSKMTSIAHISYQDVNKKRGVDFVNQLVDVYNRENNNDKNIVGYKTEQFINERLSKVAEELNATESQLAGFKSSSGLTDLSSNAQLVIQSSNEYEKKRAELQAQLSILTQLKQYVNNPANHLQVIPGNVGLTDATLTALIGQYNEAIVKRSNLLRTATESNSSVIEVTSNAEQLASAIKTSIESLNNALNIQVRNADSQASRYNARINQAPTQEKELAKFTRQREVQQELYIMLLQKREENSIALAATADNGRIAPDSPAFCASGWGSPYR